MSHKYLDENKINERGLYSAEALPRILLEP